MNFNLTNIAFKIGRNRNILQFAFTSQRWYAKPAAGGKVIQEICRFHKKLLIVYILQRVHLEKNLKSWVNLVQLLRRKSYRLKQIQPNL